LQCRLRGKLDTNGVVSALLEERLAPGLTFLLSAEVSLRHYLLFIEHYSTILACFYYVVAPSISAIEVVSHICHNILEQ
jgi:hypothetical protein